MKCHRQVIICHVRRRRRASVCHCGCAQQQNSSLRMKPHSIKSCTPLPVSVPPKPEFLGKEYIPTGEIKANLVFKCEEPNCTAAFSNETSLKCHINKHLDRKLRCSFCNLIFKIEEELTSHLDEFHPNLEETPDANTLQCKKCGKITRDKKALWRHVRESHKGPPKPCPECGVLFNRPDNLKEHMKYKHPKEGTQLKIYSCEICQKDFLYKNSFRLHVKRVHRGERKTLRCVLCNTIYGCKESYNNHMKEVHINPVFYHCLVCEVKLRNISKLNRHTKSKAHIQMKRKVARKMGIKILPSLDEVRVEFPYEVIQRPKPKDRQVTSFTYEELIESCKNSKVKIILHRVDEDQVQKRSKAGSKVSPSFKHKQEIRKYHHLICVYCQKQQPTLESVKEHEAICSLTSRTGRINICHHCDKEFDKPYKLKVHMRVHSDERPYSCSYCDASFKGKPAMEGHVKKSHFGICNDKPNISRVFGCNFEGCKKEYKAAKMLRQHVARNHLGIRHTCKICRRKVKDLSQHMKMVHVENPTLLLCRPCNRAYKTRLAMLGHVKTRRHRLKVQETQRKFSKKKETTTTKYKIWTIHPQMR